MKHIKTLAVVLTAATLCGFAFGCAKKEPETPWQDTAKTMVADKLDVDTMGKFYLDGKTYDFPFRFQELLDNGWVMADPSVGENELEPYGWNKYFVELSKPEYKNKKLSLEVAVCNDTKEKALLKNSKVGEVTISGDYAQELMIAGGIGFGTGEFAAATDLNNFVPEGFEFDNTESINGLGMTKYTKNFKGAEDYACTATFTMSADESGKYSLDSVRYRCEFGYSVGAAVEALIKATVKSDPSVVEELDPRVNAVEFIPELRKLLATDFIFCSGFNIKEPSEEQLNKVYAIMDAIYICEDVQIAPQDDNTTVVTYSAPSNFSDILNESIQDAATDFKGSLDNATSDPEFLDLVLDKFTGKVGELKIEPGKSYVIDNTKYSEGVYDVLYGMLGFYALLK